METNYYIKSPHGRKKIDPTPANDEEAIQAFNDDWTARANFRGKAPKRILVREVKEEISVHVMTPLK